MMQGGIILHTNIVKLCLVGVQNVSETPTAFCVAIKYHRHSPSYFL